MPEIEVGPPLPTYASDADVRNLLGTIGNRLPEWVDLDAFLDVAHATVVDELSKVYPTRIPAFGGNGLTVVRWAEAKFAAADVLDAIRVNLTGDVLEAPDRLRVSAFAALSDGVVGYPAGSDGSVEDPDDPTSPVATGPGPRVSSFTPLSAFPDPYESVRDAGVRWQ